MTRKDSTVFLIECSAPHWIDVAHQLKEKNITVSYWTGWSRIAANVQKDFPTAIFHDTFQAKIACNSAGEPYDFLPFDDICTAVWRSDAQVVYDMMNRFDHSRDQTFVERSILFSNHLTYWKKILDQLNPDLVIFSTPPHVVYDYVLLALCRAAKIKTLMYEEATIYPPYCLSMRDYVDGSSHLSAAVKKQHVPSQTTLDIVAKLKGHYKDAKPVREVVAHEAMDSAIKAGLLGLHTRADGTRMLDNQHKGQYTDIDKIVNTSSLHKQRGKSLRESFKEPYANSRFMDQLIEEFHFSNRLRDFYSANTTDLEHINQPYVYVALAGQPERTSNPQADIFANQLLMINLIAHALPAGWTVAVREHPNQFHPEFAVNMCRSIEYYQSILRLPQVKLLPTRSDPFDIIDKSQIVATSGGTTALEGIARGKPALLFGDAWYRDCPGVFRIRTAADMQTFFKEYAMLTIHESDFTNFVEAITKGCFRGLADYPPADYPMDAEENVMNLTQSVLAELEAESE